MKIKKNISYIFIILFLIYFIACWINVNRHNSVIKDDGECWKYNIFRLLCLDVKASENLAEYEAGKPHLKYTDLNELELLAHLLNGEAGANWCSDEMMFNVGSVALNRVKSDKFPNTLQEVIYQQGQYACTWDGNFNLEPSDRAYQIAQELLDTGSVLPDNVLFQAEFTQGSGIYVKVQNMYFCYE